VKKLVFSDKDAEKLKRDLRREIEIEHSEKIRTIERKLQ